MMTIKNIYKIFALNFLCILVLCNLSVNAQDLSDLTGSVELQTSGTTGGVVPFWMRSNQFGSIPLSGLSASLIGKIHKPYTSLSKIDSIYGHYKIFDYGYGINIRTNIGNRSNVKLIEGYIKGKAGIFQLKAGRFRAVTGFNGDTILSSGNFAVSGNALPIPKVEISIPNYLTIPIWDGLLAFKGTFSHGWVGKKRILDTIQTYPTDPITLIQNTLPETYLHEKSFYGRLGRTDWKLKLYGGFSHQVMWGNEADAYGENYKLSPVQSFYYVVTGKGYGNDKIPRSKIGNQIGSIDIAIEYNFRATKVLIYRQNLYEVGALAKLANIADGLNGVSFENNNFDDEVGGFQWKKILVEYFFTKNQAGYPWSTVTKSGDEDYYNNYYYRQGWSYFGQGIGNPFITPKRNAKEGQASLNKDYFINNRVSAWHLGMSAIYNDWTFLSKLSYSWNYGTFATSVYGKSTGSDRELYTDPNNIFKPVQQFSFIFDSMKSLNRNFNAGFLLAVDQGRLLDNTFGILLKINKNF